MPPLPVSWGHILGLLSTTQCDKSNSQATTPTCRQSYSSFILKQQTQVHHDADKATCRDLQTSSSPRLLRSLKAKRDYLRNQLQHLHLSISSFTLRRQQPAPSTCATTLPADLATDDGSQSRVSSDGADGDQGVTGAVTDCVSGDQSRGHAEAGLECAGGAIMTLLGEGCMDKSDRPGAREDNRVPTACQGGRDGDTGHLPYESLERQLSEDQPSSVKAADHDDELPLGSEANNLRQCGQEAGSRSGGEPFQDKRLLWLRQNGGHIPNSGWTSFNSELSNLTSGSSANSVEWLLQERQADPEQVLLNLGFGGGLSQSAPMFTRIPERFLQAQNAPLCDEVPLEGNEAAVQQNSSRASNVSTAPGFDPAVPVTSPFSGSGGASGWQTARTLSAAMFGIKMLSSLQQSTNMGILGSVPPSTAGSPPCVTPPGKARSVLHPDNQRALALQGFYGDNLPEGIEVEFSNKREVREEKEDDSHVGKSAEDKRKLFHSTRSKHQRSLVEAGGEEAERVGEWTTSRDSVLKSVDFSTTTESTDSEHVSLSPDGGNVFHDVSFPPVFTDEPVPNIEDLYFPEQSQSNTQITKYRKKMTEMLMADLSNDDNYFVSPPSSRQTTVEKSAILTQAGVEQFQPELNEADMDTDVDDMVVTQNGVNNSVSIVVSQERSPCECSIKPPTADGIKFLSIVNIAVDRLSDSGSDYTLVDHQSNSGSESPRPLSSLETVDDRLERQSVSEVSGFADLEQGPILYHRKDSVLNAELDENDNLPDTLPIQIVRLQQLRAAKQHLDDELPRMNSIHSDSSGFGDAEVIGECTTQDTLSQRVSHLGSSCESSTTQKSTCTLVNNMVVEHSLHDLPTLPKVPLMEAKENVEPLQTSDGASFKQHQAKDGAHYISWCYVPLQRRADNSFSTQTEKRFSGSKAFVLGKTRVSVVVPSNDKPVNTAVAGVLKKSGHQVKNESSLFTELTLADTHRGEQLNTAHQAAAASVVPPSVLQLSGDNLEAVDDIHGRADEFEESGVRDAWWHTSYPSEPVRHTVYSKEKRQQRHCFSEGDEMDGGSAASLGASSVYSCASTNESIASGVGSDVLDCQKLMKLINQPTSFKGRKTCFVHYKPKRHMRDWPNLVKKKRLQEETRLAQYAVQKFKTELSIMETSLMVKYQMAYDEMSQADREDVEEVQCLWGEVRQQVTETEHLLSARMKAVSNGNDSFSFLAHIDVLHRLMDLLKEQMFQIQTSCTREEEEEDMQQLAEEQGYGSLFQNRHASSWTDMMHPPFMKGRFSSSLSYQSLFGPHFPAAPYQELRNSLLSEFRQELRNSLQMLQFDMKTSVQERESEIHRLQSQLLARKSKFSTTRSQSGLRFPRRETNV